MFHPFAKKLTKEERSRLQELHRVETYFKFAAELARGNTAVIPKGQMFSSQLDALVKLLEQHKSAYLSGILNNHGIQAAQVNMYSGVIKPVPTPNVPPVNREAPKQ